MTSTVKLWIERKGIGFIENPDGGDDIFVHHSGIIGQGRKSLDQGDRVTFETRVTERGLTAFNLTKS